MDTVLDPRYIPKSESQLLPQAPGYVVTVDNVLTAEECKAIIDIAEYIGFRQASIYTDHEGKEYYSDTRKSARCIVDSHEFARCLWNRLEAHIPTRLGNADCVGINERLRILRYDPGDEFKPHSDGSYASPSGALSKLTIIIYLNVGYVGGFTHFLHEDEHMWVPIEPAVGRVAIQDQTLLHCVPPVQNGRKYAIRTEVMYQPLVSKAKGQTKDIVIYE